MSAVIQSSEHFLARLQEALDASQESDFWKKSLIPATKTILATLLSLQSQGLLFTPEGKPLKQLTLTELLRWYDLVSLKSLAFILDQSNQAQKLLRTTYTEEQAARFTPLSLEALSAHLIQYSIALDDELADFPNRFYVQHQELGHIVNRLMKDYDSSL